MSDFTPEFIAAARATTQTAFESSDRLPPAEGLVFVTDVDDAPIQVIGRLGSDGRWYSGSFLIAPLDHVESIQGVTDMADAAHHSRTLVLRDEPVAEAMIRYGIDLLLNAALAGRAPQGFAEFKARLMAGRFRRGGRARTKERGND